MSAGYSGTPLTTKLGFKAGFRIRLINQPDYYLSLLPDLPADVRIVKTASGKKDAIHYFTKSAQELAGVIGKLRDEIEQGGMIWISWPKKSSKVETDLDENVIR